MSDYSKYVEKANIKITQYGNPITLIKRSGEPVYNPDTDEYEQQEQTFKGYAIQSTYSGRMIDGTNIKMGDVKFMTSIDEEPMVNDKLNYMGKEYTIISVSQINPNGEKVIYYDIQGR